MDETYVGPFYQGFVFVLVSSAGKANHILTISLQIDGFGPNAGIIGSWRSQDTPASLKPVDGWSPTYDRRADRQSLVTRVPLASKK